MLHAPDALRAYVAGETSEVGVLSAFRSVTLEERARLVREHRTELERIDGARLLILESVLLPFHARSR